MLKRIGAWLLLLLFVLLLINIMFIGWQTAVSGAVYVVVFIAYAIFALRKNTNATVDRNEEIEEAIKSNSGEAITEGRNDDQK